jgi:hypothetical protein
MAIFIGSPYSDDELEPLRRKVKVKVQVALIVFDPVRSLPHRLGISYSLPWQCG